MALSLLVPRSAVEPRHRCNMCGTEFPAEHIAKFARHLRGCAKRHEPYMEAMQAKRNSNVFTSPADPELYDHIRAGGT